MRLSTRPPTTLLFCLLTGTVLPACSRAQVAAQNRPGTVPTAVTTQTVPSQHNFARWEKEIAAYEQMDRVNPPPRDSVLFIGSSTIRRWKTLERDFPEHRVINRGFGGSQIVDSTHFAERIIFPYKPRMIVLRAGGNDIHAGKSPEQVFADYRDFVAKVHARLPKARIVYISTNPTPARWTERDATKALNSMVREYAHERSRLGYLETDDMVMGSDGRPRDELFVSDRLHFSDEGYRLLADRVRTILPEADVTADHITVAAYYYPCEHHDPRWDKAKYPGFTEWDLIRKAKPRFPGHKQPRVPLWGYTDESDPQVMAQKIDAAANYGVDAFIFDWYYYDDGPYLQGALERGFLKAGNNQRIKFGLMWANHDWYDIQGYNPADPIKLLYPGKVTPSTWETITNLVIARYFKHPSYWKIDGKPYFSIYDMGVFLDTFGSVEASRKAVDGFRAKVRAAGFPGLHFNAVLWGQPNLPGGKTPANWPRLCNDLALDSLTGYTWVHHGALNYATFPTSDYVAGRDVYLKFWERAMAEFPIPYFPNTTINWDNSPRAHPDAKWDKPAAHVVNPVMLGNTPAAFEEACRIIRDRLLAASTRPKVVTVNAWNEWPEGSVLEPDQEHGYGYLEAIQAVFGSPPPSRQTESQR